MVTILMHPFVINPFCKTGFFSLYHYDLMTQSKELRPTIVSVNEWIGGHCLYRNIMPIQIVDLKTEIP